MTNCKLFKNILFLFQYFGVEFYGECWYGENNQVNYQIDGPSQNCYQNRVGKSGALMVYRIVN